MVFGTGLAILYLTGRSRIVKKLYGIYVPSKLPPAPGNKALQELKAVEMQTYGSFGWSEPKIIPREKCELLVTRSEWNIRSSPPAHLAYGMFYLHNWL